MDESQKVIYSSLVSLRNNETTLRWTRIQIFFLVHSAVLTFLTAQDSVKIGSLTYTIISGVGFILALVWLRLTLIIRGWVAYWDARLADLERNEESLNQVFGSVEYARTKQRLTATYLLMFLAGGFAIMWFALTILSLRGHLMKGGHTWFIGNLV